ncbi:MULTISPECIES: SusC/RagA family TonB-linked outer membrane protein [Pedobacter]|uniref:TonB-dependent receptor n=1 Tax=Pedobacter agri TaxID=454586 RepID=A0A9X3DH93_9SPHI|nr:MULTISPECIES: TonB-dependent receptor [Pedobacter]AZI23909.1 TonB-dependent receptor [Pedobacter sp. G11]MCX3266145.1 TonB-dependent receptor [Pedobacter agri]
MRKKFTLLMVCILCGISLSMAQNITIKGQVKDQKGLPLPGVSVKVKGTNQGASTADNGSFSITAPQNATLEFSFIGFKAVEEAVNNRTTINVILSDDNQQLNEVVVIGYGTTVKKDLTTAVVSVSSKDLENQPITNPLQAIQGRAAGVQVSSQSGKPGAGISISIRGNTSITASNSPLYVIDGVTSRDASFVNANDIESMTILKDASAAAIYGSSGANGVVLITTKKGSSGKLKVAFNAFTGFSNFWQEQEVLNSEQYVGLMRELGYTSFGGTYNTDWQKETFGTGKQNQYQVSLSGGTKSGQYYFSTGYQQDQGVVAPAKLDRLTANFNATQNITPWLKLTGNAVLTSSTSIDVGDNSSVSRGGVILGALTTPPTIGIFEPNGQYTTIPNAGGWDNPLALAYGSDNRNRNFKFIGAFGAQLNFTKDLYLKSTISTNNNRNFYRYFTDNFLTTYGRQERGVVRDNTTREGVWLNENILNYTKNVGKNAFTATGGYTIQSSDWKYNNNESTRFYDAAGNPTAPSVALTIPQQAQWSKQSYLARVTYAYDSKYLFSSNFRADGSSRFAKENRFGYFPSVSAGWRISGENFMKESKTIDDLKIRGSWGKVGNDEGIGDYAYLKLYSVNAQGEYNLQNPANNALTWEKTTQTNVGVDLTMFKSRITFSADAYLKKTNDLLINVQLPPSSGFGSQAYNVGAMENKGLEFTLSTKNFDHEKFKWTTDLNFSLNRNKVTDLGSTTQSLDFAGIYERDAAVRVVTGMPLGSFYGYVFTGVNPATGAAQYADTNGNGVTGSADPGDRTFIGSAQPKFIYGMTNNLTYGNWNLNIFFQGVQGSQLFNATRIDLEGMFDSKNQSTAVLDRWTTPGQITNIPKALRSSSENSLTSSRFVEDASYLRLKTATLSYSFGQSVLEKLRMSKITLFATGYNLLTFTKYSGLDPEVNVSSANGPNMGVDFGTYPQSRSILFGVNVGF